MERAVDHSRTDGPYHASAGRVSDAEVLGQRGDDSGGKKQYYIREGSYGAFYPGRCCDVVVIDGDKETVREEEERES